MPVKVVESNLNVLQAAKIRIRNVFANGCKIYLSFSSAKDTLSHIEHWRGLFIKTYGIAEQKHYKTMYEGLLYGDPKMRILRILWTTIYNDHNARIKEEQNHGKH